MKAAWLLGLGLMVNCGSSKPNATTTAKGTESSDSICMQPLRQSADVAACLGKVVTLIGPATQSKQPTVLGVDADVEDALTDGADVTVTGKLEPYRIEPTPPGAPIAASRGPGNYVRIVDDTGALAKATR